MPEAQAALGFMRTPSEDDPRRDPELLAALRRIAPGTELRQGMDDIIRSREGALIVIGDPNELSFLFSGGIRLDVAFTGQLLYEVAKMDGAIIVTPSLTKLAYANVQLMPDPTIPSVETGTRHRTAERVAKQTGALVISISQQRATISAYVGPTRYQLEAVPEVLAKTNQAVATLEGDVFRGPHLVTGGDRAESRGLVFQHGRQVVRDARDRQARYVPVGHEGSDGSNDLLSGASAPLQLDRRAALLHDSPASDPNRTVPAWCAVAPIGMPLCM